MPIRRPSPIAFALLAILPLASTALADVTTIGFEDRGATLSPGSFYNGSDGAGGFTSGGAGFNNDYTPFGWTGWSYSNTTNRTTPGFGNQYSAVTGSGFNSATYGVAFASRPDNQGTPTDIYDYPVINLNALNAPLTGLSARITNTTYADLSMRTGDTFSRKFGGASGNDPDYLMLRITGYSGLDKSGTTTGSTDFYLADFRNSNNALDYIVEDWRLVDLAALLGAGTPRSIGFQMFSSDVGDFGINTPTYFALDDLRLVTPSAVPEPGTLALAGIGLAGFGLMGMARRRGRKVVAAAAVLVVGLGSVGSARADFDPQVGQPGSLGIARTSSAFVGWASSVASITRGPQDISNPNSPLANSGDPVNALGTTGGTVSLGDGGSITLGFDRAITNGAGADFAVFENGFTSGSAGLAYLELGFVEVSSDGQNFFRFDATSLTQTATQVGSFGLLDASKLNNLAGKYIAGYGTGFDLAELAGRSPLLDVNAVRFVRIVDVVGSIDSRYGTKDSLGNLINDPFTTPFASSGFDFSGIGVIHAVPEPSAIALAILGSGLWAAGMRRRRIARLAAAA